VNLQQQTPPPTTDHQAPTTIPRTAWFTEARFGMFVHFGLYSVPAGVWNGVRMGRNDYAEWIQTQGNWPQGIPAAEYQALTRSFNPTGFDANEWVSTLAEAGMRYLMITSKHHDGFALWPSNASAYNVAEATPFARDILGELKMACDAAGIRLGFYYSHWLDWEHPGGGRPHPDEFHSEPRHPKPTQAQFEQYWQEKCLPQVTELLTDYDPALLWFDTWAANSSEWINAARLEELIGLVRSRRPACLINSRIGTWGHPDGNALVDLVSTNDNAFPDHRIAPVWETSGTMNGSWGHHQLDYRWQPTGRLIRNLVRNTARGGNYQLNVGPKGDGTFPAPAVRRLREIGAWMGANAEAIHGAQPNPLDAQSWGEITCRPRPDGRKGTRWYLHPRPEETLRSFVIHGVSSVPERAFVLETGQDVTTELVGDGLQITLPAEVRLEDMPVVMLE
jgi:alpha-L-fucosidase